MAAKTFVPSLLAVATLAAFASTCTCRLALHRGDEMPGLEGWRREALLAHRDDRRRAHRQARQPVPILASGTRVRVGSGARMDH